MLRRARSPCQTRARTPDWTKVPSAAPVVREAPRRCDPRPEAAEKLPRFRKPWARGALPTLRRGARKRARPRGGARPRFVPRLTARRAHIRRLSGRRRAGRYGLGCRSLFETGFQFDHGAADEALHGAERDAQARGQFLICITVEK